MKNSRTWLLLPILMLGSSLLQAHTALEKVEPQEAAVMHKSPAQLELGFTDPVQLLKLAVVNSAGVAVDTGFKPAAKSMKTFQIALPVLAPAAYKASWTVVGKDGHRVQGSVDFKVDPAAEESAGVPPPHEHEHHEQH